MAEYVKRLGVFVPIGGFLLGVFCASIAPFSLAGIFFVLFLAIIVAGYSWLFVRENNFARLTFLFLSVFLACSSFGLLRYHFSQLVSDGELAVYEGQKTNVTGKVVREPEDRTSYRQYVVELDSSIRVLVRAELFPKFEYADVLSITGKLEVPEPFETEEGITFDYPAYLSKEGISYIIPFAQVEKLSSPTFSFQRSLFRIKNGFMSAIERVVSYPESGLLGGILLGVQGGISKDLLDTFRVVGLIHIVVLSGYNITIVAESIRDALRFFSRRTSIVASVVGIAIFIVMVGAGPSVLRAGIMAMIALFARATRRTYDVARALALAGFFMVLWNPKVLVFDLGFQLSFLATIALVWFSPIVSKKLKLIPERFGLRDIAATTIAVQLFVMPLLIYSSGLVSFAGFVVNLLVLPLISPIMFFGFVTGVLSLMNGFLAFLPAVFTQALLWYVIWIAETASQFPGSTLSVSHVSPLVPIAFYLCSAVITLAYVFRKGKLL